MKDLSKKEREKFCPYLNKKNVCNAPPDFSCEYMEPLSLCGKAKKYTKRKNSP